jgi:hypothetical protein
MSPWVDPASRATGYKVTAANWNDVIGDLNFLAEIGYAEITSGVPSSATTVGTAVQVVTLGAITYEAVPTLIEFYTPRFTPATNTAYLILRDGTTVIGVLGDTAATSVPAPLYAARRLTPTAASHSYNVALWVVTSGTATVNAGSGGAAGDSTARLPAWMRATRLPT